jgi:CheY-like chemotaxis protein
VKTVTAGERAFRVVVAEDDEDQREGLVMRLEREGHRVITLEDGYELLDYVRMVSGGGTLALSKPDFIIADVRMPGLTGLDVLDEARRDGLRCPILILTGYNTPDVRMRVSALGNAVMLIKPVALDQIAKVVAAARASSSAA